MAEKIPVDLAKDRVVAAISGGASVAQAVAAVGRQVKTYEMWRRDDKGFAANVDAARAKLAAARERGETGEVTVGRRDIPFAEWRKEYLDFDTYPHMTQWIDVIEGRDPVPLAGCEWRPSLNRRRLVINVPPFHAKSQTITVDYVTYRICMDPNVRVIIVSKRKESAGKFLYQIKQRLTSTQFLKLQAAYAPEGGFKPAAGEGSFSQSVMYVNGRTADHKDPTVEVLGLGGQIYGSRADLIILDDCVVGTNANEYEKQIYWLESEVESRVKNGSIILVGTRLATQDMYSALLEGERYLSGRSPWSYLRQPMVREFADDPEDWKTLWPRTSSPSDAGDEQAEDGTYPMWDGPACARIRDAKPPAIWSLVYQQMQTSADAVFKPLCVNSSVGRRRKAGPLTAGAWGHPAQGGQGMYTIASMDPAVSGDTFVVVGKVDRTERRRYIENCFVQTNPSPTWIRDAIKRVSVEYGVNEWVIEEQGFQGFLVHDPEIRDFLASRGIRISGHYTGRNKSDPDFGVASLEGLFGTVRRINDGAGREVHNGDNLIELPDPDTSQGVKALIEQLLTWVPGVRGSKLRMDGPMALWFWELRARIVLGYDSTAPATTHMALPFLSRGAAKRRTTAPYGGLFRRMG